MPTFTDPEAEAAASAADELSYNKQQIAEIENQNKLLKEQDEILQQASFSYDKRLKLTNQIVANEIRILELSKGMTTESAEVLSVYSYLNEQMGNITESLEGQSGITGKILKSVGKLSEAIQMRRKLNQMHSKERKEAIKGVAELQAKHAKLEKEGDEDAIRDSQEKLDNALKGLSTEEKITLELHKQGKAMKTAAYAAAPGTIAKGMKAMANAASDPINAYSAVSAEVHRLTNGNTALMESIKVTFDQGEDLWKMGITHEKIATSIAGLEQRSLDFKNASMQVHNSVGLAAAQLDSLGVSTDATGELFNIMTKNFGQSAGEFEGFATQMLADSKSIGVNIEKYTSDFQASFPVLSKYGKEATDVFHRLAAQSRKTGLSVQELTTAMGQFDTFEGAAENASKLNMLLGSQLDTTRLLAADESERIEMIKSQFSGEQFQKMDRFRKKAIAAAAGFSDVGTFEKAMSGGELGELGNRAETANIRLAEAAERATNTTDSSAAAMANAASTAMFMATNFDVVKDKIHYFGLAANSTEKAFDLLASAAGVISFVFGILSSVTTFAAVMMGAFSWPVMLAIAAITVLVGAIAAWNFGLFDSDEEEKPKQQQKDQAALGATLGPAQQARREDNAHKKNEGSDQSGRTEKEEPPGFFGNLFSDNESNGGNKLTPEAMASSSPNARQQRTKQKSNGHTQYNSQQTNHTYYGNNEEKQSDFEKRNVEISEENLAESREQNRNLKDLISQMQRWFSKPHQTTFAPG